MAVDGGTERAFATLAPYRDGAIYVGHYSGSSEWERHPNGDEIVMVLEGSTTVVLKEAEANVEVHLAAGEMVVVPRNTWHRFVGSNNLKVMTVTPQPTDHSLEDPA